MPHASPNDRFFGTYKPVLDAKNRVTVPAAWRSAEMPPLMAFFDEEEGVVWLLDRGELTRLGQMVLEDESLALEDALAFREHLYSNSMDCPLDAQGRVLLPAGFVSQLGMEKGERELTMIGKGSRIEIWSCRRLAERAGGVRAGFNRVKPKIRI